MPLPQLHSLSERARYARRTSSAALLITLLLLALMALIVVGFLGTMTWEKQSSLREFEGQRARGMATLGLDTAVAQLRFAFGTWDAPYGTLAGATSFTTSASSAYFCSVSPGLLTRWSYSSVNALTNYALFSVPTDGTTTTANLNAPGEDGIYPILGVSTPLNVYWVNVLAYPKSTVANNTNVIVGRYAFWVDDENAKINLNTADGTYNTNMPPQQCGLGWGTPSAVSLQELQSGGVPLSMTTASNIVAIARTTGFNSPREILRVPGVTMDTYTNNVFNLTTMSRSPDLNVFGQPKIPLIPMNMTNLPYTSGYGGAPMSGNYLNLLTLQPLRELFPSQPLLPALTYSNPYGTVTGGVVTAGAAITSIKWPTAFPQVESEAYNFPPPPTGADNNAWSNGKMIAQYLSGVNPASGITGGGKYVVWPQLPGASTMATNYLAKYTARQLDSISAQIVNMVSTDASPDFGTSGAFITRSADLAIRGWLSGQLVNGVGRNPKLNRVLMTFTPESGVTPAGPGLTGGAPPKLNAMLYMEFWMPSGFSGVSVFHQSQVYGGMYFGTSGQANLMSSQDFGVMLNTNSSGTGGTTNNYLASPGPLPKLTIVGGAITTPANTTAYASYWGNNLLRTSYTNTITHASGPAGIDWQGNNPDFPDMDQGQATNHPYSYQSGTYYGAGMGDGTPTGTSALALEPVFRMDSMIEPRQGPGGSGALMNDFAPGEYRTVGNTAMAAFYSTMTTNAAGGTVAMSGGLQCLTEIWPNRGAEMGAVPLEAMRGSSWGGSTTIFSPQSDMNRENEYFTGMLTPYTNVIAAVIPINTTIPIPANAPAGGTPSLGSTVYVTCSVADPLVNKFPGDWQPSANPPTTPDSIQLPSGVLNISDDTYAAIYNESATFQARLTDPQSYWLPPIDNIATLTTSGSPEPPQIPRTSRFPSSGYLQYIRTGIIPDDETQPYISQHGTPFRLLNFNSSTDSSQTLAFKGVSYPDWAMLDLFYSPSSLLGYGSPYEVYANPTYTTLPIVTGTFAYEPTHVTYNNLPAVSNMFMFGTYGGATSGRINPNGAVVYTTNTAMPTPGITRTTPFQALLHNITVNQGQTGAYVTTYGANDYHAPVLDSGTFIDAAAEATISASLVNSLTNNTYGINGAGAAPFRMPGEICNVPAIASYVASHNATRNDLVRQIIGNLTTQSNTFSIWVEGQTITKTRGNVNYGQYEPGDTITGTVRYHYVIERDLNTGTDGVYGNAIAPGPDGIVGTLDDPLQGTATSGAVSPNPPTPSYIYRILSAEEIR